MKRFNEAAFTQYLKSLDFDELRDLYEEELREMNEPEEKVLSARLRTMRRVVVIEDYMRELEQCT